jgi:hypothetical protein
MPSGRVADLGTATDHLGDGLGDRVGHNVGTGWPRQDIR